MKMEDEMKKISALLKWCRDQLGLDGDPTQYEGLHPNCQTALARANSTIEQMFSFLDDIQTIGLDDVNHVRQYVRASWTMGDAVIEGDRARADLGLDMPTKVVWLFGSTVRWETTGNVCLVTVPSMSSARTAVVMVVLPSMDEATGWLDWRKAVAVVSQIFDDVEEAETFLDDVTRARRTVTTVIRDFERARGEGSPSMPRRGGADF